MMAELPGLLLALIAGAGLGVIFFGGLWLTLRWLPGARWPMLLALGSLLLRMGIVVGGILLVIDGSLYRLLACVLGFIVTRQLLIRRMGPRQSGSEPVNQL
jgi:F1F0 ATPase subunit 2